MSEPLHANAATWRGPVVQFAGSLFFSVFVYAWTLTFAIPFVILCMFLPFPKRYRLVRIYGGGMLWVLKWSCGITYRIEGEPLPDGAHIALWKHSSSWETMAMMVIFPRQVWVLKRELTWVPVVGWASGRCTRSPSTASRATRRSRRWSSRASSAWPRAPG